MDSPQPTPAQDVLDREYLEVRAKLLQIAASLDRMDRGDGSIADDPKLQQFRDALKVIGGAEGNRAERIQMIFSRHYDASWREALQMPGS
jgi:hypothetical protein